MKYKITKDDFEKLDEGTQVNYKQDGDNYVLKVEGMPDTAGLISRIGQLESSMSALEKQNKTLQDENQQIKHTKATDDKDIDALNNSWQEKFDKLQNESQETISSLKSSLEDLTVGAEATRISSELAVQGSADVLRPHVKGRLKTEFVNGEVKTTVLGPDGKPSALTLSELADEFKANPAFAPLIVGTKANGSGHKNSGDGSSGTGERKTMTREAFRALDPEQRPGSFVKKVAN